MHGVKGITKTGLSLSYFSRNINNWLLLSTENSICQKYLSRHFIARKVRWKYLLCWTCRRDEYLYTDFHHCKFQEKWLKHYIEVCHSLTQLIPCLAFWVHLMASSINNELFKKYITILQKVCWVITFSGPFQLSCLLEPLVMRWCLSKTWWL